MVLAAVATMTTATLAVLTTANTGEKLHFLYFILPVTCYSRYLPKFLICASSIQHIIFLYAKSTFTFSHKKSILHFVSRKTNNKWQQLHYGVSNNCTWVNEDKPATNITHITNNLPPSPQNLWQENRQFLMSSLHFFPTVHTIHAKLYKEVNFFHDCQLQYGGLHGEGTKLGGGSQNMWHGLEFLVI